MTTHIGLYFPYFHFPNDEWLKVSSLYWDKVYRIVPKNYRTDRDTKVVTELEQHSFIRSVNPEEYEGDLNFIKTQFLKLIVDHEKELVKCYGIENRDQWHDVEIVNPNAPPSLDRRFEHIFDKKLDHELIGMLEKTGLAMREDESRYSGWIGMHPRLANVYMAALAELLANRTQTNPLTNEAINYFAVGGFTFERLAQVLLPDAKVIPTTLAQEELEAYLANIAIQTVMPKNIYDVSVENIIAIREKYSGQFGVFQDFIHRIVVELPNLKAVEGQQFVNDHLEAEFTKNIKPKLDELDDAINSLGIETVPTILNMEVNVPTVLAGGGVLAGAFAVNPILGATAAVAMGIVKIIGDKRKALKNEISKSDVAYLMNIRDDLTPVGSLEWLNIQARKTLFGI